VPTDRDPLAALSDPEQWSWAAPALAAHAPPGDRDALEALVAAYAVRGERSRVPLLDAMEALGGVPAVGDLGASDDVADRRLAARLAHLLPDPAHLPVLEALVTDRDEHVAAEARAALRTQPRDPAWRALVRRLAQGSDPELAAAALAWEREG
jgi:hypothetical protein